MELPEREWEAEDAFVAAMTEAGEAEIQRAVEAALEAQRPRLAARLVLLLDHLDAPVGSPAERAMRAARWLLLDKEATSDAPAPLVYWRRWRQRPLSRYRRTVMDPDSPSRRR